MPRHSLLAAALVATPLAGQTPAALTGVVYDSLARAPLGGAAVQLQPAEGAGGRTYFATADAAGRFRVDSVAPGRYVAAFFHPRVDSLGVALAPVRVELRDGATSLDLAFPSAAGVQRQLCAPSEISDTTALLVGHVRDAATRAPRRGAAVRLRWTELVLGRDGAREARPEIVVHTRGDGWYGVCGVPTTGGGDIGLVAESGGDTSGVVPLRPAAGAGLVRRDLFVGREVAASGARVRGVVRAASGKPVPGARVQVLGGATLTTTDEQGTFALAGQPLGSRVLDVRAVGYVPARVDVDLLDAPTPNAIAVTLTTLRRYLDTVKVAARRAYDDDHTGFERRRRTEPTGYFLTREAIARRGAVRTTDLLNVSGLHLGTNQFGQRQVLMRGTGNGGCAPTIFMDGMPMLRTLMDAEWMATNDIDMQTSPDRLQGIEVYREGAAVPDRFRRWGGSGGVVGGGCGAVVLWTRPRDPAPRRVAKSE